MTTETAKQQRFVQEYPIDLNDTQAVIRAGYSRKTVNRIDLPTNDLARRAETCHPHL